MACRGNPLSREHTQSSQRLISRTNEHFLNPNPGFPLRGVKQGSFERPDSAWIDPEMRNTITEGRAHEARDRFIDSIDEGDVLRLASSHHNGGTVRLLQTASTRDLQHLLLCALWRERERREWRRERRGDRRCCRPRFMGCSHPAGTASLHPSPREGRERGGGNAVGRRPSPLLRLPRARPTGISARLLTSKTTIPIPKVHAYSAAPKKGPFGVASYIILEYVEGTMLSKV